MRTLMIVGMIIVTLAVFWMLPGESAAAITSSIRVLGISEQDETAMIRDADGKSLVVRPGDALSDGSVVAKITADSIVIEEPGNSSESFVIRLVGGRQRIERVSKAKPPVQSQSTATAPDRK